jgi:glycosyltransferase involved in cell wall biosynthesis
MKHSPIAVIVPAFNEEKVIAETLEHLLRDAKAGEFEVTVVCNGCHDQTAKVAREASGDINVIELAQASKTAAINAGLQGVRSSKIVLLDSDIRISTDDCRALLDALDDPGVDAAIGYMDIDDSGCARSVKAFYRIWIRHPYVRNGKFAAAFAISREAMDRIGALPDVVADDTYLKRMIPSDRVAVLDGVHFRVKVPKDIATLIRVRSRVRRGNRQLARYAPRRQPASGDNNGGFLLSVCRQPSLWRDIPVYLAITIASRILALKNTSVWERDVTTRQAVTD